MKRTTPEVAYTSKYLLHVPKYLAEQLWLLGAHSIWPKTEPESEHIVKPIQVILIKSILHFIIIIIFMSQPIKERLPAKKKFKSYPLNKQ